MRVAPVLVQKGDRVFKKVAGVPPIRPKLKDQQFDLVGFERRLGTVDYLQVLPLSIYGTGR